MAGRQAGPSVKAKTFDADTDLTSSRYCFAKVTGAEEVGVAGAGELPIGVVEVPGEAGMATTIGLIGGGGGTKLKAGAAVTAGAPIKSDSTGRGVTATSGQDFYAIALETVANANEYFEALLQSGRV